nr:VirB3 family type IV secretion system protein [Phaeobacter porticola]
MAERSPLFLGLARPPKYLGLPVGYLVVLATGVVLPFIWTVNRHAKLTHLGGL